jgi:hypothetical protein
MPEERVSLSTDGCIERKALQMDQGAVASLSQRRTCVGRPILALVFSTRSHVKDTNNGGEYG